MRIKYARLAVPVYFLCFASVLFWWKLKTSGQVVAGLFVVNTEVAHDDRDSHILTTELTVKNSSTISKRKFTSHLKHGEDVGNENNIFNHSLTWQWKNREGDVFISHFEQGDAFCNGNFIGYDRNFAKLVNVVIDPSKGKGRHRGENISQVFHQAEKNEYYDLKRGYFKLQCDETIHYEFNSKTHLRKWQSVLRTTDKKPDFREKADTWTVVIQRYEYANLYHTMTDFYNVFLVSKVFNMELGNITILWVDGHPSGALDSTWETLFGRVLRAGDIQHPHLFSKMIWGIMGYDSPLHHHGKKDVPYLEEFRSFFLSRYGINSTAQLNCESLKVMFLWRRDYLAHPRNPSGSISRKIQNENELINATNRLFPGHGVYAVQIDQFSMKTQLNFIAKTDILIGMHGAGLSHSLFLPKHAGLIELYPTYWPTANIHFKSMARWRNLHYMSWINVDKRRELQHQLTVVDVSAVTKLIDSMARTMCNGAYR